MSMPLYSLKIVTVKHNTLCVVHPNSLTSLRCTHVNKKDKTENVHSTPICISCMPNLETSGSRLSFFSKISIKFRVDLWADVKASADVID